MRVWRQLTDFVSRHGSAALITVHEVKGSAPREVGAHMVVRLDGAFHGTIGGGREVQSEMVFHDAEPVPGGAGPSPIKDSTGIFGPISALARFGPMWSCGTRVRSWTGAVSIAACCSSTIRLCESWWPAAIALPPAPMARARVEAVSAVRTAWVMGASLNLRLRRLADCVTFRMSLIR